MALQPAVADAVWDGLVFVRLVVPTALILGATLGAF